jgi:hypothetical protein
LAFSPLEAVFVAISDETFEEQFQLQKERFEEKQSEFGQFRNPDHRNTASTTEIGNGFRFAICFKNQMKLSVSLSISEILADRPWRDFIYKSML